MKLVTYAGPRGDQRLGAVRDDRIVDLKDADGEGPGDFDSMLALIRGGSAALDRARALVAAADLAKAAPLTGARLFAPLPIPEQVRCFSAFEQHARNSARVMLKKMAALAEDPVAEEARLEATGNFKVPPIFYERPLYYKGNRFNWAGPDAEIAWPSYSQTVDYEVELACIIGTGGRDIPRDQARPHIFGYAICNDLSARDAQAIEMRAPLGPAKGKDFDGGNVMGPYIVTADAIDPYDLTMTVHIDGEVWGSSSSKDMEHPFERMIEYVSQSETLHPGEVILSGCFADGSGMELGRSLARGVTIEIEIEGLGVLRNRIV